MYTQEGDKIRLSDRILSALQLALSQKDIDVSEQLAKALELSMTRKAGGGEFVERRSYPLEIEEAMDTLASLRAEE